MTIFFRLLDAEDKGTALKESVSGLPQRQMLETLVVNLELFKQVPGVPFAYWVSTKILRFFSILSQLESEFTHVRVGLQTSDDNRFLRLNWEVFYGDIFSKSKEVHVTTDTWKDDKILKKRWFLFPKGGHFSPYYCDIYLVVDWLNNGKQMKGFASELKQKIASPPGNGPLRDFPYCRFVDFGG